MPVPEFGRAARARGGLGILPARPLSRGGRDPIEPGERTTILIHYYRALVGRADIWRMRMDATTNWAIGTTAAVATFAVGNAGVPHFGIFVATLLTIGFLLLEARRLTFYHLWQQRVLRLERGLIAPAVDPAVEPVSLESLAPELGRTVPTMSLGKAVARRLRRVYSFVFVAQGFAWLLKLASHAGADGGLEEILVHARIGAVPGAVVAGLVAVAMAGALAGGWLWGGVEHAVPESR